MGWWVEVDLIVVGPGLRSGLDGLRLAFNEVLVNS